MDDQKFEELAKKYPDLFQKSIVDNFECGDGWYNIIDSLCHLISAKVDRLRSMLRYYIDRDRSNEEIYKIEEQIKNEIEKLPTIIQVKEKFGSLRFYIENGNDEINNYIVFAESISYSTCEVCGSPGEPRNDGWVKVLCEMHHKARDDHI